jgi:O-antigen/teichoic acid export membrane protein
MREILRLGSVTAAGNMAEQVQPPLQNLVLSWSAGLSSVGLFAHAQAYQSVAMTMTRAFGDALWPTMLAEARDPDDAFRQSGRRWPVIQVTVTAIGIVLAALGSHVIRWLTHDKFTSAYAVATLLVVVVLIQTAGRPALAVLFVRRDASFLAVLKYLMLLVSLAVIVLTVPQLGAYGLVLAAGSQFVVHRAATQARASKHHPAPPQVLWVVLGSAIILATLAAAATLRPGVAGSAVLCLAALGLLAVMAYPVLGDLRGYLRDFVGPRIRSIIAED